MAPESDAVEATLVEAFGARAELAKLVPVRGDDRFAVVQLTRDGDLTAAIEALREVPEIEYAEPHWIGQFHAGPSDPYFKDQWGMNLLTRPRADIRVIEAWGRGIRGSADIRIGVVDSGVDIEHADLSPNIWNNPGEVAGNSIDDDGNGLVDDVRGWDFAHGVPDTTDVYVHGTHLAGIMGAVGDNGVGVAGINWSVAMVPMKIEDEGSIPTKAVLEALAYARWARVRVINVSWGFSEFSQAIHDAFQSVHDSGILTVIAAGNDSKDKDVKPDYPAGYGFDSMINVAATMVDDSLAGFSSYGKKSVHLGAPGFHIQSTVPRGKYQFMHGTSMAAPHVTGAAALIWSIHPDWDYRQVREALLKSADRTQGLMPFVIYGRLNVSRALETSFLRAGHEQLERLLHGDSASAYGIDGFGDRH